MISEYMQNRMAHINAGRPLPEKKTYQIPKVSKSRAKKLAEQKESGTDKLMDKFFETARKSMVGTCQCGCTKKSSKHEDAHYRCSVAHVFPKRIFKSIATNQFNWVERNFWDGCHSRMDDTSIEKWVNFADWDDIKERFHALAPLLTDEERATKFYSNLEKLVYS